MKRNVTLTTSFVEKTIVLEDILTSLSLVEVSKLPSLSLTDLVASWIKTLWRKKCIATAVGSFQRPIAGMLVWDINENHPPTAVQGTGVDPGVMLEAQLGARDKVMEEIVPPVALPGNVAALEEGPGWKEALEAEVLDGLQPGKESEEVGPIFLLLYAGLLLKRSEKLEQGAFPEKLAYRFRLDCGRKIENMIYSENTRDGHTGYTSTQGCDPSSNGVAKKTARILQRLAWYPLTGSRLATKSWGMDVLGVVYLCRIATQDMRRSMTFPLAGEL
eukprot:9684747-Prorocentrum_lima.AAC.1